MKTWHKLHMKFRLTSTTHLRSMSCRQEVKLLCLRTFCKLLHELHEHHFPCTTTDRSRICHRRVCLDTLQVFWGNAHWPFPQKLHENERIRTVGGGKLWVHSKDPKAIRHEASYLSFLCRTAAVCMYQLIHIHYTQYENYLTLYFSHVLLFKYPILYVIPYFQWYLCSIFTIYVHIYKLQRILQGVKIWFLWSFIKWIHTE